VNTHHAPVGAWTSLVFGAPGRGLSIAQEALSFEPNADLLVAVHRGAQTVAMPFVREWAGGGGAYSEWRFLGEEEIARTLTPCVDEFDARAVGLKLRVLTPHAALPNPKRSGNLQYATAPGVLLEVTIDNTGSDLPATGFVGICSPKGTESGGRLRPVEWSSRTLCGIASGGRWLLAAPAAKEEVFGVQSARVAEIVAGGAAGGVEIDPRADVGGVVIKVGARASKTVTLVFCAYQQGLVTQGIDARYLYNTYFPRLEAAANFLLHNAGRVRESCASFDGRAAAVCPEPLKLTLFAQGVRAYEASTQVLDGGAAAGGGGAGPGGGTQYYFAAVPPLGSGGAKVGGVGEGGGTRNPLDRVIDHLPWELYRNPWVIRNVFDLATTSYAYHDKVRFPLDAESPLEPRDGGMTFARDFGFGTTYAPATTQTPGVSAFDGGGTGPGWSGGAQASEVLLNAIYLLTGYALLADDTPWAKTRLPFARELMTSLENRDHWDPEKRNGLLKAESISAGEAGEVTAFAGLDPVLAKAHGNIYLAVKTFCANLMLTTYFQNNNDLHSADYSYAFAQKTAQALVAAFDAGRGGGGAFPANVLHPGANAALSLAALEPLAVPTYLGLTTTLGEYFPELFNALRAHAMTCLAGGCVDAGTGAIRLVNTSADAMPSKVINVLYVLERLFGVDVAGQYPGAWKGVAGPGVDGALVSAALYIKPAAGA
jgi:hypothetical protein